MKLTRHTDFALRVLLHLGVNPDRPVPVSEIAATFKVSQNHLVKVVQNLIRSGFLASTRGRSGGVRLAKAAEEIGLGAVVRATEPDMVLVDCLDCTIARQCALPGPFHQATRAFLETLDRYSIADLVAQSNGIEAVLARV